MDKKDSGIFYARETDVIGVSSTYIHGSRNIYPFYTSSKHYWKVSASNFPLKLLHISEHVKMNSAFLPSFCTDLILQESQN